ncbi:homoserine dehydrogenase [Acidovorax sp. SUPP3334]|uniref:homoserine dehydrogenase n=1 Tax=Acidovorax sp. SUPP3334 TaxID=2920881 RepID=UPI0023DE57DA|nr:homoserine dehydrogenase [Acidovorax sp. SUPP3334]GKT24920.1 homoserine dehydrogenase [Acidovorax sp. SUPP3334]
MFNDPHLSPLSVGEAIAPAAMPRPLRVGMIGIGTVGAGTWRVLRRNQGLIAGRAGRGIEIVAVAARNLARAAKVLDGAEGVELTDDPLRVATHPGVDVVVEAAGGTGPARDWVLTAIAHGKHVVTANKALLAVHGNEIFAAAQRRGVAVAYEGAVAVSIPIIKALREGLTANRIEWVAGIINGTTNFILTQMRDEGLDFDTALAQAQALGYAEADPSFDVDGVDAAHKATLLAANAFGMPVRFEHAHVEGIRKLQATDVACAETLGFRIKLLGMARRVPADSDGRGEAPQAVELRVHPALVPARHLLAQVDGSMNAVLVKGDACGVTMYYGAGAGSEPTASAVVADLVDVARLAADGNAAHRVPSLAFHPHAQRDRAVLPMGEVRTRHYLRVPVAAGCADAVDQVAGHLALAGIGVQSLQLHTVPAADGAAEPATAADAAIDHVLVLTHTAADAQVQAALERLRDVPGLCVQAPVRLRVEMLE